MLVAGTVNVYEVEFTFDNAWDGYSPVAVFEGRAIGKMVTRKVAIDGGKAVIPWETLLPNGYLRIGVYGLKENQRLPTIYTERLQVQRGAEKAEPGALPTPGVIDQILIQTAADREAAENAARQSETSAMAADQDKQGAEDAKNAAELAKEGAESARTGAENARDRAETAAIKQPYPNPETETWWVWDAKKAAYVDSGEHYGGNTLYATFDVDPAAGTLSVYTPTRYSGPLFALNEQTGKLEVSING